MCILVTGCSGFIGASLTLKLLQNGEKVVGVDNHNDYYSIKLKEARLEKLIDNKNFTFEKIDISNFDLMERLFEKFRPSKVVNLAAQAGVRYSLENPKSYIDSNIVGFGNILELCRDYSVKHLVYASSSSVYGANTKMPFSESDNVDHPLSLYAASKKSNELMAHSYSHLYNIPTTGLRFFTVYGPWDRPDMALQKFAKSIVKGETIKIFNFGKHRRDFTYIDDIVEGVIRVLNNPAKPDKKFDSSMPNPSTSSAPWRIYNIGNNKPVNLLDYIEALEYELQIPAKKEFLPIQPGDVPDTWADVSMLMNEFSYKPKTSIKYGVKLFVKWYRKYYSV